MSAYFPLAVTLPSSNLQFRAPRARWRPYPESINGSWKSFPSTRTRGADGRYGQIYHNRLFNRIFDFRCFPRLELDTPQSVVEQELPQSPATPRRPRKGLLLGHRPQPQLGSGSRSRSDSDLEPRQPCPEVVPPKQPRRQPLSQA